jgi:TetR/AcrR family transcriptional repressor of nem operon
MNQRDPMGTRRRLLQAGFREFHRVGFAAASLERILQDAGVTKGALYHHFRSKRDLGYAVIMDILQGWIRDRWLRPLESASDPIGALQQLALWGERHVTEQGLALGCPLQGMVEELSGVDEGFRVRLESVYEMWRGGLAQVLSRAQRLGQVRAEVDVEATATFVVAAWQGSIGLAKAYQSAEILRSCRQNLSPYLETLKQSGPAQATHR